MDTTVEIETDFIPLSALLKLAGAADSGGSAKHLVQENHVKVNGEPETRRAAKIRRGDEVVVAHIGGAELRIRVS